MVIIKNKTGAEKLNKWNEKFTRGFNRFERTDKLPIFKTGQVRVSSPKDRKKREPKIPMGP